MKNLRATGALVLQLIGTVLMWCITKCVRTQLYFDRKVLKRYLGIETPFYKMWHYYHVKYMQRKLDKEHKNSNFKFETLA